MSDDLVTRIRNVFEDTPQIMTWFDEETYVGAETRVHISGMWETLKEAADRIEKLEAALEKIAQHDMQAVALDALRPNERIRGKNDD